MIALFFVLSMIELPMVVALPKYQWHVGFSFISHVFSHTAHPISTCVHLIMLWLCSSCVQSALIANLVYSLVCVEPDITKMLSLQNLLLQTWKFTHT